VASARSECCQKALGESFAEVQKPKCTGREFEDGEGDKGRMLQTILAVGFSVGVIHGRVNPGSTHGVTMEEDTSLRVPQD